MSYLSARTASFRKELSTDFYRSTFTFNGRTFYCVASSRQEQKNMSQANYIVQKPAVFDLPRNDMVLSDGVTALGFAESGMALRSTVSSEDTNYEIFSIQDDPVEPFVRLQCNRKQ